MPRRGRPSRGPRAPSPPHKPTSPPTFSSLLPPPGLPSLLSPCSPANSDPSAQLEKLQASVNDLVANAYKCRRIAAMADVQLGGGHASGGCVNGISWEDQAQRARAGLDKAQADVAALKSIVTKLERERKVEREAVSSLMRDNDALKTKLASSAAAEEDAKAQFADAVRTIEKLKAEIAHTPVQDDTIHLSPLLRKRMVKQGWSVGPNNGRKSATPKCVKPAARAGAPLSFHSPSDTCPLVGRVDVESPTDVSVSHGSGQTLGREDVQVRLPTRTMPQPTAPAMTAATTVIHAVVVEAVKEAPPSAQVDTNSSEGLTQGTNPAHCAVLRSGKKNSNCRERDTASSSAQHVASHTLSANQTALSVGTDESKAPAWTHGLAGANIQSISTALAIKSSNTAAVQLGRRTGSSIPTLTKPPGVAGVYGSVVKASRKKGGQTIDNSSITTALPTPEFDQSRVPLAHGKAVESEAKAKKSGKKKKMKKPAGENVL